MNLKTYTMLTKPGIIMGNIITTAAGFALASRGNFDVLLFLWTLLGLSLVIASAGVFNNYIDKAADAKMSRTKNRPLVRGLISDKSALLFGFLLGIAGFALLLWKTNLLTALIAFGGYFVYLVLYAIVKYRSFYGTIVGSLAGAVPPLVGYCAVSDRIDLGAIIIFTLLVLWQMPHFFAIAIYRMKEYASASIPVLPTQRGVYVTKVQIFLYILAFTMSALLLAIVNLVGALYLISTIILCLAWTFLCVRGFISQKSDILWAKQMFQFSLVVIMGICLMITVDRIIV